VCHHISTSLYIRRFGKNCCPQPIYICTYEKTDRVDNTLMCTVAAAYEE